MIQSIQEETATNIYFPSPLQGLVGPDVGNSPSSGNAGRHPSNVIWITGEFFGVQRARDMLYSVSVNKVNRVPLHRVPSNNLLLAEQARHISGHCNPSAQVGLDGHRSR